jgi:hypothetical protein
VAAQPCFEQLDNGVDMSGWTKATLNHHGPGDGWSAEGGMLVGRQVGSGENAGGLILSDKSYSDFEAIFEVWIDWGCDSGFMMRTTGEDRAYQVTIDHLDGNSVGGIWGESFSTEVSAWDFVLRNNGTVAEQVAGRTPLIDLADWPTLWNPTGFNEVRVRMEGNPPKIDVWISGTLVNTFQDTVVRGDVMASGPIGLQVHEGDRWIPGGAVRYRNVRVRDLTVPCSDADAGVDAGGANEGGASGTTNEAGSGGTASSGGSASTGGAGGTAGQAGDTSTGGIAAGGSAGSVSAAGSSQMSEEEDSPKDEGCGCAVPGGGGVDTRHALISAICFGLLLCARKRGAPIS